MFEWLTPNTLIPAITGLVVAAGSYLAVQVSRRDSDTTEAEVVIAAWRDLLAPYTDEVEKLRAEVAALSKKLDAATRDIAVHERHNRLLQAQLAEAGINPWRFEEVRNIEDD